MAAQQQQPSRFSMICLRLGTGRANAVEFAAGPDDQTVVVGGQTHTKSFLRSTIQALETSAPGAWALEGNGGRRIKIYEGACVAGHTNPMLYLQPSTLPLAPVKHAVELLEAVLSEVESGNGCAVLLWTPDTPWEPHLVEGLNTAEALRVDWQTLNERLGATFAMALRGTKTAARAMSAAQRRTKFKAPARPQRACRRR